MNIDSKYIEAANALRGKKRRKRIIAYVESYDDVFFWRTVLADLEDDKRYFEVMLPTRKNLTKGKKTAMMQVLANNGGGYLIACVDADYDYLLQGASNASKTMLECPHVFHTYAYAIENFHCFAPSLHNACVMATLNDRRTFDFVRYLTSFSEIIYPVFVWNIWFYRQLDFHTFSMSDFNHVAELSHFNIKDPQLSLDKIKHKVTVKLNDLNRRFKNKTEEVEKLSAELGTLGVTPQNTYMFIQGHHLFDNIVSTIIDKVCKELRSECETNIRRNANHSLQRQNELSAYTNAQNDITQMLKKNIGYMNCEQFKRIRNDINQFLALNQ